MRAGTLQEMGRPPGTDLIAAQPEDAERLASLSRAAKLSYREWAQPGWEPPSLAAERSRWERRLADPAGWTLIASDARTELGTVHFTNARAERGEGAAIAGRAHLSGLFVLPTKWGQRIGGALLAAALEEMRNRGYREAQLFTAAANRRSRTFYEATASGATPPRPTRTTISGSPTTSSSSSAERLGLGPLRQPGWRNVPNPASGAAFTRILAACSNATDAQPCSRAARAGRCSRVADAIRCWPRWATPTRRCFGSSARAGTRSRSRR